MRWLSRLVSWFLGWPLLAIVSLVASLLFHLDTGLGHRLGRDMLNEFVSGEMVGTLHAGYITQLRLWRTVVKDTFVYDPDGNAIIYGETVEIGIDPIARSWRHSKRPTRRRLKESPSMPSSTTWTCAISK